MTILAFVFELPESPRWLILKGKEDEALNVLGALGDLPIDDPYIYSEFTAIKDTVLEMSRGGFRDLFSCDQNRHLHRTVLAYVNQMFQQISGINLITYYAATIYQNEIKLSPFISRILAAANGTGESRRNIGVRVVALIMTLVRVFPGLLDRRLYYRKVWQATANDVWCHRHVILNGPNFKYLPN